MLYIKYNFSRKKKTLCPIGEVTVIKGHPLLGYLEPVAIVVFLVINHCNYKLDTQSGRFGSSSWLDLKMIKRMRQRALESYGVVLLLELHMCRNHPLAPSCPIGVLKLSSSFGFNDDWSLGSLAPNFNQSQFQNGGQSQLTKVVGFYSSTCSYWLLMFRLILGLLSCIRWCPWWQNKRPFSRAFTLCGYSNGFWTHYQFFQGNKKQSYSPSERKEDYNSGKKTSITINNK